MTERLKFQGKLLEKKQDAERLKMLLRGLVRSLRDALDPTDAVEALDRDLIIQQAAEFGMKQIDLLTALEEIRVLKKELGER